MARYIDVDDFRKNAYYADTDLDIGVYLLEHGCADVVPKSEYEALKEMLDATIAGQETLQKALVNAKAEVAREIFEEIEKQSIYHFAMRTYGISELKLAKLKKKYTQERPKCKHFVGCEPSTGICDEYEEAKHEP